MKHSKLVATAAAVAASISVVGTAQAHREPDRYLLPDTAQ